MIDGCILWARQTAAGWGVRASGWWVEKECIEKNDVMIMYRVRVRQSWLHRRRGTAARFILCAFACTRLRPSTPLSFSLALGLLVTKLSKRAALRSPLLYRSVSIVLKVIRRRVWNLETCTLDTARSERNRTLHE